MAINTSGFGMMQQGIGMITVFIELSDALEQAEFNSDMRSTMKPAMKGVVGVTAATIMENQADKSDDKDVHDIAKAAKDDIKAEFGKSRKARRATDDDREQHEQLPWATPEQKQELQEKGLWKQFRDCKSVSKRKEILAKLD